MRDIKLDVTICDLKLGWFQKNAWNGVRSEKEADYNIDVARAGCLPETLKGRNGLTLFCVPPTRLAGTCRRVLMKILKKWWPGRISNEVSPLVRSLVSDNP